MTDVMERKKVNLVIISSFLLHFNDNNEQRQEKKRKETENDKFVTCRSYFAVRGKVKEKSIIENDFFIIKLEKLDFSYLFHI